MNDTPLSSAASAPASARGYRRYALWLLAVLAVGVLVAFGVNRLAPPAPTSFGTTVIERGNLEKTVTAVGALQPKDYVDVGTQVSGRVEKVHVEIGDRVDKGDLIAEIDSKVYESTVRKDQANLDNLKAQLLQQEAELALARQQYDRYRQMLESRAVSQDTVDQAEATLKVNEASAIATTAQIKAAQATLEGDLTNLGYTKIYAPMAGTVVSEDTLEGQTVNSVQSAPVIVQVANLDVMTVWAQVAEADVNKIQPGMPAYFTTLGMRERRWRGVVRQVQPTPETENDVVLYNVLIDVDNTEGMLLPSMTVQVFFVLGEAKDATLAPLSALTADKRRGADAYTAVVMTDKGPMPREVKVGLTNRSFAQVLSGLEPGERVVDGTAQAGSGGAAGNMPMPPMGMGGMGPPRF